MARELTFSLGGREYAAAPAKVDRKKLYGWTETLALDDDGNECRLVSMDETGTVIIPAGGVGLGVLSPEMEWVDRSTLKAVTLDGQDASILPSSYSAPIELQEVVTPEEYLSHSITAFYQILGADPALVAAARDKIYTFPYLYRDGYEGQRAFLMESDGNLYMMLGYLAPFELLGLDEVGIIEDEEADDAEEEESDDIDFGMF